MRDKKHFDFEARKNDFFGLMLINLALVGCILISFFADLCASLKHERDREMEIEIESYREEHVGINRRQTH